MEGDKAHTQRDPGTPEWPTSELDAASSSSLWSLWGREVLEIVGLEPNLGLWDWCRSRRRRRRLHLDVGSLGRADRTRSVQTIPVALRTNISTPTTSCQSCFLFSLFSVFFIFYFPFFFWAEHRAFSRIDLLCFIILFDGLCWGVDLFYFHIAEPGHVRGAGTLRRTGEVRGLPIPEIQGHYGPV